VAAPHSSLACWSPATLSSAASSPAPAGSQQSSLHLTLSPPLIGFGNLFPETYAAAPSKRAASSPFSYPALFCYVTAYVTV
jgi:hypothetical protein